MNWVATVHHIKARPSVQRRTRFCARPLCVSARHAPPCHATPSPCLATQVVVHRFRETIVRIQRWLRGCMRRLQHRLLLMMRCEPQARRARALSMRARARVLPRRDRRDRARPGGPVPLLQEVGLSSQCGPGGPRRERKQTHKHTKQTHKRPCRTMAAAPVHAQPARRLQERAHAHPLRRGVCGFA